MKRIGIISCYIWACLFYGWLNRFSHACIFSSLFCFLLFCLIFQVRSHSVLPFRKFVHYHGIVCTAGCFVIPLTTQFVILTQLLSHTRIPSYYFSQFSVLSSYYLYIYMHFNNLLHSRLPLSRVFNFFPFSTWSICFVSH